MPPSRTLEEFAEILHAFERAVSRETYNLSRWPDLTWQQLHNRLQWEGGQVPDLLENGRRQRHSRWILTRTPFRESPGLLRTLGRHTAAVDDCGFAPDGSYLASHAPWPARSVTLWDPERGEEIRSFGDDPEAMEKCLVSRPDGSVMRSGQNRRLMLWDPATGEKRVRASGFEGTLAAVSPDGSYVISAMGSNPLEYPRPLDPVTGQQVFALKVWDRNSGSEICAFTGHNYLVEACAISPDGSFVVSGDFGGNLKLWDPASGRELITLGGHADIVRDCAVAPDGSYVVTAGQDATLKLWDPVTGEEICSFVGHTDPIWACVVSPDGAWIASAGADGTVKIWDSSHREKSEPIIGHTIWVSGCAVAPDGSYVLSASGDRTLMIWDPMLGSPHRTLVGHRDWINACAVAPDGSFVVSAGGDHTLRLWDPETGEELRSLEGHTYTVEDCAVAADGSFVLSAGGDYTLRVWDSKTGEEHLTLRGHAASVEACVVTPDGSSVVSGSEDKSLKIWNLATGREVTTLQGHEASVEGCAVSPDGSFIVSGSKDKTLKIWDTATGEEIRSLRSHSGEVRACAVSPDGAFVVSGSEDGRLDVWDASSGAELLTIPLLGGIKCLALHPWLPRAFCGVSGGGLHVLDFESIQYGPIIVTAVQADEGLVLKCPICQQHLSAEGSLGQVVVCARTVCRGQMRVNPFVLVRRPTVARGATPPPAWYSKDGYVDEGDPGPPALRIKCNRCASTSLLDSSEWQTNRFPIKCEACGFDGG